MENVVQAEMDADIRRCGLFGVISVALGLLLRIGLMPVASGQIDLDTSIWLIVDRCANVVISIFGFISIAFSRVRRMFVLTVAIMLVLLLTNAAGCVRMMSHL